MGIHCTMVVIGLALVAGVVFIITGIIQSQLVGVLIGIASLTGGILLFVLRRALRRRGLWRDSYTAVGTADLDGDADSGDNAGP
jgi:uncharacterized membrane protein HdeD (DUF308 family)